MTIAERTGELRFNICDELDRLDINSAITALDEMYSTYIQHCIEDGVPAELHDDIFCLHKSLRVILYAQKELAQLKTNT
jgi:hypothetical protein